MEELQDDDDMGGIEGGERVEEDGDKVINRQIELQLPITALSRKLRIGDDRSFVGMFLSIFEEKIFKCLLSFIIDETMLIDFRHSFYRT